MRGSVVVDKWLLNALAVQRNVSDDVTINYSTFPATHNSAIAKTEGYGVGEDQLTELLHIVDRHSYVRIADQQLSITDQLRTGIRMIEIDTHWFDGQLRIAHW